jgi:hypothetical protein
MKRIIFIFVLLILLAIMFWPDSEKQKVDDEVTFPWER